MCGPLGEGHVGFFTEAQGSCRARVSDETEGQVWTSSQGAQSLRTCVLSWGNREPWKLCKGVPGQKCDTSLGQVSVADGLDR